MPARVRRSARRLLQRFRGRASHRVAPFAINSASIDFNRVANFPPSSSSSCAACTFFAKAERIRIPDGDEVVLNFDEPITVGA